MSTREMGEGKFRYEEVIPIRTRAHSVWIVEYESGALQLLVMDKEFTMERVVEYLRIHGEEKKWEVGLMGVGAFNLDPKRPHEQYMMDDARRVNQEGEMVIH